MQLTSKASVESLNTRENGPGIKRSCRNLIPYHSMIFFPMVAICWDIVYKKTIIKFTHSSDYKKTLENIPALSSAQKPLLHFNQINFYLEHIGDWSQAKDCQLSPGQTSDKVNRRLHSHHL